MCTVRFTFLALSLFLYGPISFPFLVALYSRSLILVEKEVNLRYVKSAKESIPLKINKAKDKKMN